VTLAGSASSSSDSDDPDDEATQERAPIDEK